MRALLEQHTVTPFTIFDLLFACLDAHLDPHFRTQRMSIPTPASRLAAIAFICLFPLFLLANFFWGGIVSDPRGILYSIFTTNTNPLAHFSENMVIGGTLLTWLAALIGGLLVAGQAIRYGLTARRWGFLFAASLPLLMMLLSLVAASMPMVDHSSISFLATLIMAFTALLCGLAFALLAFQQGKMGQRIVRILLVPATITALVMPVMVLTNIVWAISLWSDIFQTFSLPSGTFFSWFMGWAIDFLVMALPTLIVLITLIRAIRPRKPAAPQQQAQAQSAMM